MIKGSTVYKKRKKFGVSQEELAGILGVSRPTIVKIEKENRALKPDLEYKFKEYFKGFENEEKGMRINDPKKDLNKFKQVLLYILERVGAKPNIGLTVLYKLLYFIDFDYYEKYEEQLMGLTYFKNTYGPAPREFKKVVDQMIKDGEIEEVRSRFYKKELKKFLPHIKPDLSLLNGRELEMIDSVLDRYSDKTAKEMTELSHRDMPWKAAEDFGSNLEYEHVFYRNSEFSVREYDEL